MVPQVLEHPVGDAVYAARVGHQPPQPRRARLGVGDQRIHAIEHRTLDLSALPPLAGGS